MAASDVQTDLINEVKEEPRLKYLSFVQVAATRAVGCFSKLYGYAKENAGPLKHGVQSVEGAVKTVVGPVYEKFQDGPLELLKFVDRKVDESIHKLEKRVPPAVKEASTHAYSVAQKAPEVARSVADEVQRAGVVSTATSMAKSAYTKYEPVAKDLYAKYEPRAEQYAVLTWRSLNRLPLFPHVAQIMVPTAAHWTEKYNRAVQVAAERGYSFSAYMPIIPIERIVKVFSNGDTAAKVPAAAE